MTHHHDAADSATSRPERPTVLLVEDSAIVRQRLAALILEDAPQVHIVAQAGDGREARLLFHEHRPAAVVLDLELPVVNGLDLLVEFKTAAPACLVLVLTNYSSAPFRDHCTRLGADGFFDKPTEFERVPETLARLDPRPAYPGRSA